MHVMGKQGPNEATEPVWGMAAWAHHSPDRPALVAANGRRSYGELADRSTRLAAALGELGLDAGKEGDGSGAVAVMLSNRLEWYETAAAACRARARLLPVNWHLKADELAWILADSGAAVLVAEASMAAEVRVALAQAPHTTVLWVDGDPDGSGHDYETALATAKVPTGEADEGWQAPAFIFYTSGTTGRPKGVVHGGLRPDGMAAAQMGLAMLWGLRPDDVHLLAGPAYHAGPCGWTLTSLFAGGSVVVLPQWDAREALAAIERERVTTTFMTPSHFIRLLEVPDDERARYDTSSLRLVIHAGAPCPISVKHRIIEALPHTEVWELYGASEGGATRVSPQDWLARPGTVGQPWPGVELRILDAAGDPVPTGTEGIIYIAPAHGATFHYHGDEAKTAQAWREGAFTVGDIGRLDADGWLYLTDRVSDMVIRDGVNIYPREIEDVLHRHAAVVDCAVFGVPDARRGEVLAAVVETRTATPADELATHVRAHLADFKCPEVWRLVDTLPRDPNGKVLKRLLRAEMTAGDHRPTDWDVSLP